MPSWLLVVATGRSASGTLKLESADLFPVWRFAVQWSPEALPSSQRGSDEGNRERRAGAVAHARRRRPATIRPRAFFRTSGNMAPNGNAKAACRTSTAAAAIRLGVGVRIHGGGSRITAPRPGFDYISAAKYGPREVPPGVLFSPAAQPIRRSSCTTTFDAIRRTSIGISSIRWPTTSPGQSERSHPRPSPCDST